MISELGSLLAENPVLIFLLSQKNYTEQLFEVINGLISMNLKGRICYVLLNKPYASIVQELERRGIDRKRFFFIDAVTSSVQTPGEREDCVFVDDPTALTDLNIAVTTAFDKKMCDSALFDAISTLVIYQDAHRVIMFSHTIINKVRIMNKRTVFILLKEESGTELVKDLSMFADRVVDVAG